MRRHTPAKAARIPCLIALLLTLIGHPATAGERRWTAADLFQQWVTQNVNLAAEEESLELQRGVLVEDDGPAAGYTYGPNVQKLGEGVRIRKRLVLPEVAPRSATLLVAPGGDLQARVNGQAIDLKPLGKTGNYWRRYAVPPKTLRGGANDFDLHGTGAVWIALDEDYAAGSITRTEHPNRSFRSTDGGRTWQDAQLGTNGRLDGEFYVRLFVDQYRADGQLVSPVLDSGNLGGDVVAPPLQALGPLRVELEATRPDGTTITVELRSGTTFVPGEKTWGPWTPIEPGTPVEPKRLSGRFVQLRIRLSTNSPDVSPRLRSLRLVASPKIASDWTRSLSVVEFDNPRIVRSSIPFAYEPFTHPRLRRLRERLEHVARGAESEFDLIVRLAKWSATRWEKGHLGEGYPEWDALKILEPHADGTPVGGFCQQYNVVFLQACEAFGIPGRAVSLGPHDHLDRIRSGHEVVEVWSNDFQKWIYVDGDFARYARDAETGDVLSLLELRRIQWAALHDRPHDEVELVDLLPSKKPWKLESVPPFFELRMIPRSDFLKRRAPLPLNQGMRGWFWTGHYVWTDAMLPARPLYSRRVANERNWSWTLNQAELYLEGTSEPGRVRVHVDTETPGLDHFAVRIDGERRRVAFPFEWSLHGGTNELDVRPVNTAGRKGIRSRAVLRRGSQ